MVHMPNSLNSYQMFTQANTSKAENELKFRPAYDLRKAIKNMSIYIKENEEN